MTFLSRLVETLVGPKAPPLLPLWEAIVGIARDPRWYLDHGVADTVDGRFDMVALVTSLVMLRLERDGRIGETALLTEAFVADMDGSVRELGIGDMVVGKHVGRMTGALGGRITAYRAALDPAAGPEALAEALARNVYRGGTSAVSLAAGLEPEVRALVARIAAIPLDKLLDGRL